MLGAIDEALLATLLETNHKSRDASVRARIAEVADWLAVRSARRFSDRGEPFDDLLQVARIGLLKAIDRFDPAQGVPFGAYATPTIIGEIRRYFRDHTWSVHVPRRAKDLRPAVNGAVQDLWNELGRSPQVREIAARLSTSEDVVIEVLEANEVYRARSLDSASTAMSSAVTAADDDATVDRELVRHLLDDLAPRERRIVQLRFFTEMSQAQIAEEIGISQVHVGRLLEATLAQLRIRLAD